MNNSSSGLNDISFRVMESSVDLRPSSGHGVDPMPVMTSKEGTYQDRPPLCPFRLLPLLIYSGSTIAFLKILKVQGPKSKNIENVILLQP